MVLKSWVVELHLVVHWKYLGVLKLSVLEL